ncbi:hypothetical protein EYC84_001957 [Monilinia fructicola]|uniref:Uncharacterized protein n=1 Tax=Monilinia fructicola TaxID=38448 RepID=A0A5M9JTL0_MONFR|nr:hypothetical protein EYC84_001957 [Monilinia fructicola]
MGWRTKWFGWMNGWMDLCMALWKIPFSHRDVRISMDDDVRDGTREEDWIDRLMPLFIFEYFVGMGMVTNVEVRCLINDK